MKVAALLIFSVLFFVENCYADDCLLENSIEANYVVFYKPDEDYQIQDIYIDEELKCINKRNVFNCTQLDGCTLYTFKYIINNSTELEKGECNITTKYALPTITNFNITSGIEYINITWKPLNINCQEISYKATIKADQTSIERDLGSADLMTKFSELDPCTDFTLSFQILDSNKTAIFEKNTTFSTEETDPGKVIILNATSVEGEPNSVLVSWEAPKYRSCVKTYNFSWKREACYTNILNELDACIAEHQNKSAEESLSFKIENLFGCTDYILSIQVNGLPNIQSELEFSTITREPGAVKKLDIVPINNTIISLEWDVERNDIFCIKDFYVRISGPNLNVSRILSASIRKLTEDQIEPCGKYEVDIFAKGYKNVVGKTINRTYDQPDARPSKIENASVIGSPYSVEATWQRPKFAYLCIKYYRIAVWLDQTVNETGNVFDGTINDTKVQVLNLGPCQNYRAQIISVYTSDGISKDGEPALFDMKTTSAPLSVPSYPQPIKITSTSLKYFAMREDNINNCPVMFSRFICETAEQVKFKYCEVTVPVLENTGKYEATVEPLSPNTKYKCSVKVYNTGGWSDNAVAIMTTGKYYPKPPELIDIKIDGNNSIHIKWYAQKDTVDDVTMYKVHLRTLTAKYRIPSDCKPLELKSDTISKLSSAALEHIYSNAEPYVEYSIQIASINSFGTSEFSLPKLIVTNPSESSEVQNFNTTHIEGPKVPGLYSATVTIQWRLPCNTHGEITSFEGTFYGIKEEAEPELFNWSITFNDSIQKDTDTFEYKENRLKPEYIYNVNIHAIIKDVPSGGKSTLLIFTAPAGIPRVENSSEHSKADAFLSSNPTTSAVVHFSRNILSSNMGEIIYVSLLISQKGCQPDPRPQNGILNSKLEWPTILNWQQANALDCIKQYQTTPMRWYPRKNSLRHRKDDSDDDLTEFVVGEERCENLPSCCLNPKSRNCDKNKCFCNGPLKPSTPYIIHIRLFTSYGYSDAVLTNFETDSVIRIYFVILLLISCLFIAFIFGFVYLWISKNMPWYEERLEDGVDSAGNISAKNFLNYFSKISQHDKIQREFKDLNTITTDLSLSNDAARSNPMKNRYSNIYPYDKNRVILDDNDGGGDYINASFINGYKHKKEYIATQGPTPHCYVDFWRMIYQYNVHIIVMLTKLREGTVQKCHPYFPVLYEDKRFGNNIDVACVQETNFATYTKRELVVEYTNLGERQVVVQYHFTKWADHSCPEDPWDLINFVRVIKSEKISSHSPIVVHCSAGVGRTGTLIALDIIMQRLKVEKKINILETVKDLRFQRMKMVQTPDQYQFVYLCTHELVKNKRNSDTKKQHLPTEPNTSSSSSQRTSQNPNCHTNGVGESIM